MRAAGRGRHQLGSGAMTQTGASTPSDRTSGAGWALPSACTAAASPGWTWAPAAIKLNDDGSFNLTVGATDLGTGSDTILAQIAAETLGVPLEDIIVYSSDTDLTPFDTGAYASSTTYISGNAVLKAAEQARQQIVDHAAKHLLPQPIPQRMFLDERRVWSHDGRSVTLEEVALHSLHQAEQHQIMGSASHMSYESPPPLPLSTSRWRWMWRPAR